MKKYSKRVLAVVLALFLTLGSIPTVYANAEEKTAVQETEETAIDESNLVDSTETTRNETPEEAAIEELTLVEAEPVEEIQILASSDPVGVGQLQIVDKAGKVSKVNVEYDGEDIQKANAGYVYDVVIGETYDISIKVNDSNFTSSTMPSGFTRTKANGEVIYKGQITVDKKAIEIVVSDKYAVSFSTIGSEHAIINYKSVGSNQYTCANDDAFEALSDTEYAIEVSFKDNADLWSNYADCGFSKNIVNGDIDKVVYECKRSFTEDTSFTMLGYNPVSIKHNNTVEKVRYKLTNAKQWESAVTNGSEVNFLVGENKTYDLEVTMKPFYSWKNVPTGYTESGTRDYNIVYTTSNFEVNKAEVITVESDTFYLLSKDINSAKGDIEFSNTMSLFNNTTAMEEATIGVTITPTSNYDLQKIRLKEGNSSFEEILSPDKEVSYDGEKYSYEFKIVDHTTIKTEFDKIKEETWHVNDNGTKFKASFPTFWKRTLRGKRRYFTCNGAPMELSLVNYKFEPSDNLNISTDRKTITYRNTVYDVSFIVTTSEKGYGSRLKVNANFEFIINSTNPEISTDKNKIFFNPSADLEEDVTVTGKCSHNNTDVNIERVYYTNEKFDDSAALGAKLFQEDTLPQATINENGAYSFTYKASTLSKTSYPLYIYAIDSSMNYAVTTVQMEADSTSPIVTFSYETLLRKNFLKNFATNKTSLIVNASATDTAAGSGIEYIKVYVDGVVVDTIDFKKVDRRIISCDNSLYTVEFENVPLSKNKEHKIEIEAIDFVKNTSNVCSYTDEKGNPKARNIIQDVVAPEVTIAPGKTLFISNDKYCYKDDFEFEVSVIDTVSNVDGEDAISGIEDISISVYKITNDGEEFVEKLSKIEVYDGETTKLETIEEHFPKEEVRNTNEMYRLSTSIFEKGFESNTTYEIRVQVEDAAGNTSKVAKTRIYHDTKPAEIVSFKLGDKESMIPISENNAEGNYGFFLNEGTEITVIANDGDGSGVKGFEFCTVSSDNVKKTEVANLKGFVKDYKEKYENNESTPNAGSTTEPDKATSTDKVNSNLIYENVDPNDQYTVIKIASDFKGYVYVKVIDNVNNVSKEKTTAGVIIESENQHKRDDESKEGPHVSLTLEDPGKRDTEKRYLYKDVTKVKVKVRDYYSGIQTVKWEVVGSPDEKEQNYEGGFSFKGNVELVNGKPEVTYKKNDKITINDKNEIDWEITASEKNLVNEMTCDIPVNNDDNDIKIKVTVIDNAGNESVKTEVISVDLTDPTISIEYTNNDADPEYTKYFNADRTAIITVTERNFNEKDFKLNITTTGTELPKIGEWDNNFDENEPNKSTHVIKVYFSTDGDYDFTCDFTDMAGRKAKSLDKQSFTIDKTIPLIDVSYDNNSSQNGNYYKASRTATVKITEHNFDPKRVTLTGTGSDDGANIVFPSISSFRTSGDESFATITFDKDGVYKFTVDCNDKASNAAKQEVQTEFVIDLTAPEVKISGVENMSANKGEVKPAVVISDTNFDSENVELKLVGSNNGAVNYSKGMVASAKGETVTYANFEEIQGVDDIYTLEATSVDKAGNSTTETIVFSVNRFGSVYTFSNATKDLLEKYTNSPVDIEITETNVDEISMDKVKVVVSYNGTPETLTEGDSYKLAKSSTKADWSQYTYTIGKDYFDKDGAYTVSIYSVDAAGNENQNIDETKKATVSFGVDTTAPVIVPITIDSNKIYDAQTYLADMAINDNLVLQDVSATVNGETVDYTNNGDDYSFPITESTTKQSITVTATDAAGNSVVYTAKNIVVSTNAAVRIYNNKRLFVSLVAGMLTGATAAFYLMMARKRKKTATK